MKYPDSKKKLMLIYQGLHMPTIIHFFFMFKMDSLGFLRFLGKDR